jgi:hypothetical protein
VKLKRKKGWLKGLSTPDLDRVIPLTLVPPSMSCINLCVLLSRATKEKGATKQVKKLRKIDPRSQQIDASGYRFHTQFHHNLYETVIMDRRRVVSEAQWID